MTGVEFVDRLHGGIDFQPELAQSLQAKPSTTREDEQYPQAHTRLTVALESVSSSSATATNPPDSRTRCTFSSNKGLHHHVLHIKCTNANGTADTPLSHRNLESATDSDGKKDDTIRCSEIVDYMAVGDLEHILLRIFALSVRAWEQHIKQQTQTGKKEPEHGCIECQWAVFHKSVSHFGLNETLLGVELKLSLSPREDYSILERIRCCERALGMKDFSLFQSPLTEERVTVDKAFNSIQDDPRFSLATCRQGHTPPGTAIRMITGKFSVLTERNFYGTACLAKLNYGPPKDLKHQELEIFNSIKLRAHA